MHYRRGEDGMELSEQAQKLRQQIKYHNQKYYNEDAPEISDYEYSFVGRDDFMDVN